MLLLAPVGARQSGPDRLPVKGSGMFRPCARECESKAEDAAEDYDVWKNHRAAVRASFVAFRNDAQEYKADWRSCDIRATSPQNVKKKPP